MLSKSQSLFLSLIFLISCQQSQVVDLYGKDSELYPALQAAAAAQCIAENEVFENLKTTDFTQYSILTGGYIKVSDYTYIIVHSVTTTNVIFEVASNTTDAGYTTAVTNLPFLTPGVYEVDDTTNNAVVDMIAQGVCSTKFGGTPSSSTTSLTFTANFTHIQDGASTVEASDEYIQRRDSFTMNTSIPAFLFVWGGDFQGYEKDPGSSVASNNFINTDLSLTASSASNCSTGTGSTCLVNSGTAATGGSLTLNTDAYDDLIGTTSAVYQQTYYTNVP